MAIFIISRRPGHPFNERAWSYRNRLTSDNAEVTGTAGRSQAAMYGALRRRADTMAHSWRVAEPNSEFRVIDTGLGASDKFDPEFDRPKTAEGELSPKAREVLEALCQNAEGDSDGEWRNVYLDNAKPADMTAKSFRSYLAVLAEAGFYKPIDGYAWGDVRDVAFQVIPREVA